ncbi:glucan biosynthesis protein G [Yersinia ruckeri]|uniref:glucan biosynthesis protein G n=1 Tax=Yersinia ruckeri TaxID=29486 RepID=UPI0011A39CFB|nr:glucan biosynthesis protein G [Yersinia ruckeri]EKN3345086.1 glucan biosynthesis protein G [Yersinia ruckeri]EKN3360505.1 glucan biosynthesis protein G [Yersinia ruckeri]EKN4200243.1 glucan biosynthesis protein G [Yersinia ruckeri]EKN4206834.1 glucan biosynthesis protein G [Yersinia ruckeri]EKN4697296.1 glucan biosynthesis protein G [Yersinia ruckeri]
MPVNILSKGLYANHAKWLSVALLLSFFSSAASAFTLEDVAKQAQSLAGKSYEAPKSNLPSQFREMKFADYQQIQFNQQKSYWNKLKTPFKLEFYHQGMYFDTPVQINEITAKRVTPIKYNPDYFNFGTVKHDPDAVKKLGFAGFKVLYPINQADKNDEVMSMLGASYFRVIGKGQVYGLSARGLAIDTALASGEEFPRFREFWIERPKPNDKHLVIYALLDSPRATGAYRFTVYPGRDSTIDVQAKVFLRDKVDKLGIAPLTSMFLFGANQPSKVLNYRPALHDSNGLSIHAGNGEWIWRPLNNPKHLSVSTYTIESPKGFGLLQRGRAFSQYEDLDDRYDLRPSAWVEPRGDWGKGKVELVEIPTADETNDNIVAFWSPDVLPDAKHSLDLNYRLHFTRDEDQLYSNEVGYVKQTLRSTGDVKQSNLIREPDGSVAFLIDFIGPVFSSLDQNTALTPQVSIDDNGELLESSIRYNPETKGWRLTLRVKVKDAKKPIEMRAALANGDKTLTETWSYQLPANE